MNFSSMLIVGHRDHFRKLTRAKWNLGDSLRAVGGHMKRVRNSGSKFEIFWFGLGLGYMMVCNVTIVCVHVPSVILTNELA